MVAIKALPEEIEALLATPLERTVEAMASPYRELHALIASAERLLARAEGARADDQREHQAAALELDDLERQRARWRSHAEAAVAAGDDGRAREALARELALRGDVARWQRARDAQLNRIASLGRAIPRLQRYIREARLRLSLCETGQVEPPSTSATAAATQRTRKSISEELARLKQLAVDEELERLKGDGGER